jgi:uncharacterized membrane protein YoaK (UPF0700 family)
MTGIRTGPESLPVGAILAAVGGFLDAYTYVRFRVFAGTQTGNVILFSVDTASADGHAALRRLIPIAAFLLGVLAVEILDFRARHTVLLQRAHAVLALEIVLLAAVASLPDSAPEATITITVAFAAALQFSAFRVLAGSPYTTLLAMGTMRSTTVAGYRWLVTRDATAALATVRFAAILGAFIAGALVGGLTTQHAGGPAAAIAAGTLLIALGLIYREARHGELPG